MQVCRERGMLLGYLDYSTTVLYWNQINIFMMMVQYPDQVQGAHCPSRLAEMSFLLASAELEHSGFHLAEACISMSAFISLSLAGVVSLLKWAKLCFGAVGAFLPSFALEDEERDILKALL